MKKILGWAVGAFTALALAAPTWAQDYGYRDRYGRDDGRSRRDDGRGGAYAAGLDRGFHEGARDGARDGRSHRGFNLYHDRTYRDGDQGYRSSYGPRWEYERGFRQGYERGYRRGYASRRDVYENGRYGDYRYEAPGRRY